MADINIANIGKGMSITNTFSPDTKSTYVCSGLDKINESIYLILNTAKGEIPMLPDFGSRVANLLFEPSDVVFADLLALYIKEDLEEQEPRITVDNVDIYGAYEDTTKVVIYYTLNNTNIAGKYEYSIAATNT